MWKRKKTTAGGSVAERSSVGRGHLGLPWLGVVLAFAFLVGVAADVRADDVLDVGGHTFEYLGTTYDDDGSSTWSYRVTSEDKPALSHWVLEWGPSLEAANVLDASERFEVGTDPTTGVYGIKFDEGYCSDGEDDDGSGCETRTVSFTLDAWYDITDARIATKAGRETDIDEAVPGPLGSGLAGNSDPLALDDEATTKRNKYVKISVLDNDSDPDGDNLSIDSMTDPSHGQVKKSGKKKIKYTPDRDFNGIDTFTYTVSDGNGGTATALVTVRVASVNDPPVAHEDSETTDEDTPITIDVAANDSDPEHDTLTVESLGRPTAGTVESRGSFVTYVPDRDFHGSDSFSYTVSDGNGGTDTAVVSITVLPVNDPPVAAADETATDEDTPVTARVLENDSDLDGDPLSIRSVTQPADGSVVFDDERVTYTPDSNYHGSDSFSYTVSDGNGGTDTATVTITVASINDGPIAQDDSGTTDEDVSVTLDLLINDDDPDDDPLSIQSTGRPNHGTILAAGTADHDGRTVTYTPDPDFNGSDGFTYTISDGNGGTDTATVTVTVASVNDRPVAENDAAATDEDTSVTIEVLVNDYDEDGDPLNITAVDRPGTGTATVRGESVLYAPNPGFHGADSFTYTVSDGNGGSATASVAITVASVNDLPVAQDDDAVTDEDSLVTVDVLSNDHDPDGDFLLVESVGTPANGSVINADTSISYIPNPGFNGVDTFVYTVTDSNGGSDTANVTVAVAAVNDAPVAQDDSGATDEEVPVTIAVLGNDTDPDGDSLRISAVGQPSHGSASQDGTAVVYTPEPDFAGIDAFTYAISDGSGGTGSATVTVAVAGVNDAPLAGNDRGETEEDESLTLAVLVNDSDPDGDPIAIQSVTQPAHGSVSHDGTQIAYTPDPDAYGTATFSYTISDGNGGLATATVTVDVAPINDAPVARDDQGTTFEDTPNTLAVLANDSDADGDPLAVRSVTAPSHGTTETDGANVTYVPDANFHGTDSFWYTIDDGRGATATADVTITVTSTNDLPIASDDEETTDEDVPAAIDVLANDADPDGDALAVLSVTQPANGSVRNDGTDVTYTPDPNFQGTDSFSYTISDGNGGTDAASVTIRVVPVNDVPVAQSDFEATEEDTPVTVAVLANDTDPDGDPLSILSVTQPADGSVTVAGGTVTYTPSADYHGTDRFSYTIGDGQGGTSTAEVRIAVAVVNDVPVAIDDEGSTSEDTELVLRVLANDSDPDGDPLSISAVAQPANGTVTHDGSRVTYAPNPDFHGSDSFRYTASDGNGGTASATVTVSVSSVNDAPITQDDSGATEEDVSVSIAVLGNDSDPDGDALSLSPTTQPANGTVITEGGAVRYTPDPDVHGTDSFTYTISDPDGATATATVTVTVAAINDVPNATDDAASTNEDVRVSIPVLDNDIDPDGDALSLAGVSQPLHGSVAVEGREAIYAPDPDFHGTDTFTYSVSDGGGESDTAIVTVTVTPVNDAPLAQDDSAATAEDVGVSIPALDNDADPDGDPLAITQLTQPANGTASHDGRTVTYMPNAEFHGTDSFTYTVSDGNGGATTATISVAVAMVNDPPIAVDDTRTTNEDTAVTIPVLNNDTDPDADSIVVQSITQPANGIVVNGGGSVTYTPDPDFNGSDDFAYTISDGNGGTDTANVVVTVSPVNDPPVAQNDSATIAEDTAFEIDVLGNDVDPEDDRLLVSTVNQPAEGSVINHGDRISYSPSPGFHGTVSFGYTVSDGNGGSATATVTIVVTPVNDVPVAQDDSGSTQEDVPVTLGILANDIDPDGDVLTIQSVTQPGRGTVVSSGSNATYTPEPGFFGTDSFQYTVSDGAGGTDQATVTVTVTAVNDAPAAKDDSGTTEEEVAITIDVLANDSDPDGDTLTVQSVTQPANGTVAILDGRLTYTPAPGFHGIDTFTYTASDGNGGTGTATVTIAVAMVNDPPIARNDSRATVENQPVDIAVLANDDDPDGDPLSIQSVTQPANGSAVSDGTSVTYTPNPGFAGTDTFTYVVSDGSGGIDQAVVTLTVSTVNDPPIAQDDRASTVEGRPVSIAVTANDNDPDGDALTVESATQPAHGAVVPSGSTVMYTPSPGFHGTDTFSYTVSDGRGGTDSASVTVTIDPLNDPPAAQDDAGTTSEDSPLTVMILANDSDPDGDPLIVESLTQPAGGTAVNNGDSVTYIPGTGFSGTDTFTYTVSDGRGETDTATVIISVTARNNPPVAQDDSAATEEGVLVSIPVLENDVDPDGDFLLVEAFTQPANGSVLNARTGVSYIPDAGFQGIDTFEYSVSDGNGGTATATVTVSVAGVNALPVAQDDNDLTDEDVPVTILVLDNDSDPDGDVLRVESVEQPENGAVANNGIDVTYTPAPGFSGVDEFRYTVSDGVGGTATAAVFVAISPANDPPAAQNDSTTTNRDLPVALPVLDNDSDPDDDRLTVSSVTQPAHGSAATDGATVVYTPNEGFTGSDTFTYTVSDGHGGTDVATVTIGVSGEAGAGGAEEGTPCAGKVIISEVAWAGTAADPKDEWIELRNLGTTSVSLDGWELRWRRGHPNTPEEQVWKIVELSGELRPSSGRACDDDRLPTEPVTRFSKESPDDPAWLLESEIETDTGFFVLERRHENTLSDTKADLVYDTVRTLNLELSDHGEVLMLVNAFGEVVDTANAANLGRDGWVAGSASTYGSMERLDPLAADTAGNWHTNEGIVTHGADANGHLLRGTPGGLNSPAFERLERYAEIEPMSVRAGELLHVDFLLPRQDRRTTGWPWISVSRPGFVGAAGAGGTTNLAGYSFSGRYDGTDRYVLDIGTQNLPPGTYVFWITYGQGRAALVPIVVAR